MLLHRLGMGAGRGRGRDAYVAGHISSRATRGPELISLSALDGVVVVALAAVGVPVLLHPLEELEVVLVLALDELVDLWREMPPPQYTWKCCSCRRWPGAPCSCLCTRISAWPPSSPYSSGSSGRWSPLSGSRRPPMRNTQPSSGPANATPFLTLSVALIQSSSSVRDTKNAPPIIPNASDDTAILNI